MPDRPPLGWEKPRYVAVIPSRCRLHNHTPPSPPNPTPSTKARPCAVADHLSDRDVPIAFPVHVKNGYDGRLSESRMGRCGRRVVAHRRRHDLRRVRSLSGGRFRSDQRQGAVRGTLFATVPCRRLAGGRCRWSALPGMRATPRRRERVNSLNDGRHRRSAWRRWSRGHRGCE